MRTLIFLKCYIFPVILIYFISCSSDSKKTKKKEETESAKNNQFVKEKSPDSDAPKVVFHRMDEKVMVEDASGNYELRLVKKEEAESLNNHKAKEGFKYISVEIEVRDLSNGMRSDSEIPDFFLYTWKNKKLEHQGYQGTPKPYCKEPFFHFPVLSKGKSYKGWKTFEIPKDSNNLYLGYKTALFTGDFIYFQLQ